MKKILLMLLLTSSLCFAGKIPIKLEFAKTANEQSFGLMQRKNLPDNQGMLFIYPEKDFHRIWMFNCLIDLSVAFLDDDFYIREIHKLKAYPEKMDPYGPILSYKDLPVFSKNDPTVQFFLKNSVQSSFKTHYVLEMNGGWFYTHHVSIGDQLIFDENKPQAYILQKE